MQHAVVVGFDCQDRPPACKIRAERPRQNSLLTDQLRHSKLYALCPDYSDEYGEDDYETDDEFFGPEAESASGDYTAQVGSGSSSLSGSSFSTPLSCASSEPIPIPRDPKRLGCPYWAVTRGVAPVKAYAVYTSAQLQVQRLQGQPGQLQAQHAQGQQQVTQHQQQHS